MKKIFFIIIVLIISSCKKDTSDSVAVVGKESITKDWFIRSSYNNMTNNSKSR